jgi:hypothetical protein
VDVYESTAAEAELSIPASDPVPSQVPAQAPDGPPESEHERVTISPDLWRDPDVRWLTGVHEAKGHDYLVRESYEELLWWMLMPSLLRLAGEKTPSRAAVAEMSRTVEEALETAEAAGYRIDALLGTDEETSSNGITEPTESFREKSGRESKLVADDPEEAETLAWIEKVQDTEGWK